MEKTLTDLPPHPPIKTVNEFPPIPTRAFDWAAWCDGWEEDGPTGRGRTEEAAIDELQNELEDLGYAVRRIDDATTGALALIDDYLEAIRERDRTGAERWSIQRLRSHLIAKAVAYPNEDSGHG